MIMNRVGDYGHGTGSTTLRFSRPDPASEFTHSTQAASGRLTQRESWRSVRRPHCDSMIDARFGIAILSTVKSVTATDQNGRRNDRRRPLWNVITTSATTHIAIAATVLWRRLAVNNDTTHDVTATSLTPEQTLSDAAGWSMLMISLINHSAHPT